MVTRLLEAWAQRSIQRQDARRLSHDSHRVSVQVGRVCRLLIALTLLVGAMLLTACAARVVQTGRTYLVQWPDQADIVEIHRDYGRGFTQCRSVTSNVLYTCNLNTAWWWVRVTQTPPESPAPLTPPPSDGLRSD